MINKQDLGITIRGVDAGDISFILSTFLRGLYYGDTWYSLIPKDTFMHNYHTIINSLLIKDDTTIRVACFKDDPKVILGYSITGDKDTKLHWVYCKKAWRKIGIAKSLIPDTVINVTHVTATGLGILKKHTNINFNPFLI